MKCSRIDRIAASLLRLTVVSLLGIACEDIDEEPMSPEPAAARSPIHVNAEVAEADEPEEETDRETEQAKPDEGTEVTWFKGVDHLPKAHPCHDSTLVLHATLRLPDERNGKGDSFDYEFETLGELRDKLGPRWVHFDPRTVRGVRWSRGGEEFLAASCNMGGVGFHSLGDVSFLEDEGVDMQKAREAAFVIGRVGEASSVEWGAVHWMRRAGPGQAWETVERQSVWSNDDEGNDPQYVARGRIITAEDADVDGQPEVVAVTFADRRGWDESTPWKKVCPDEKRVNRCVGFAVEVHAREAGSTVTDRVVLRLDGRQAVTTKAAKPADMNEDVYETLRAQLDTHRDDAVAKARAILREGGKLR